ncbi:hypothetical protein Poli38472_010541 [Pythium oligandrum]|uniref:Uncharacterized protein n=1 Tax=Pythium oligandrum TaxID=41045 RepID=A0A8K1C375_PYTOL|nr:hypothetical protein Poli38472_010541 [Pythium oligandrum]|eukprot:TMW55659.1 hypothetical protein Poli38472_010541 [Pythium oligandrum]
MADALVEANEGKAAASVQATESSGKSVSTLFALCLRAIASNIKYFYSPRLYPPSLPALAKKQEAALQPYDLSTLHLLEEQRCCERMKAWIKARQRRKRTKYINAYPVYALCVSLEDTALNPLKRLIGTMAIAPYEWRSAIKAKSSKGRIHHKKKWVSEITREETPEEDDKENEKPEAAVSPVRNELRCYHKAITNVGCGLVAELLVSHKLVVLNLQNCQITCAGVAVLSSAIRISSSLQRLDLSNDDSITFKDRALENDIRGRGVTALASALRDNGSLQYLSLNSNPVGRDGAQALAHMLYKNRTLQRLELEKTVVNEGAQDLIQAYVDSKTLATLNLLWCGLTPGLGAKLVQLQALKASSQD